MSARNIPAAFEARGWRRWGVDSAARLGTKGPSAIVYRDVDGWRGRVEFGHRQLRDLEPTMLTAMARIEWAEAGGFFSPLWRERDAPPLPTRSGWTHGVSNGLDFWEMALQKPRWLLRVELLRASTYVRVASTLASATCRYYCSSYDVYAARDDLTWMIQHAMDAVERAAQENATRYGIPFILHPASVRAQPPATNMAATIAELADV